jgi:HD-GYP domain-containing protein (c-di-GMP phosphodiesterase class II)
MTFYLSTVILTEFMMLAMMVHVIRYNGFKRREKIWYILTFSAIMFCSLAEYAVHCGYYDSRLKIPLTILTALQFSIAPLLGVLFTGALGMRHQFKIMFIYLGVNLLVEIIAAPFGYIFYFDDMGYSRGSGFFIYGIFYFVSLAYLVLSLILVGKKFKHRDFLTIIMNLVVLVSGIVPMTFFKVNITYLAIAISACICYIYYNDLVQMDIKAELLNKNEKINTMQTHMISGLASVIENRDADTGDHISRTSRYVKMIAELARKEGVYRDEITDHFIMLMETLAPMHDIGKIIIPDSILKKPAKLTKEEYDAMKRHAIFGGNVVKEILNGITDEEYLKFATDIATYHHEKWDGTGYPKGLKGEEIPLSARIMALADVYDALISVRCYKDKMTPDEAFKIIEDESGTHFDPKLVAVFLLNKEKFL